MAKKKPVKRRGKAINAWIPEDLSDAVDRYLADSRPRLTKSAIIENALEEFLAKHGLWPPAGEGQP